MDGIKHFIQVFMTALSFIWRLVKAPSIFLWKRISAIFRWYKKIWVKFTHNKYDEFVYKRGVAVTTATLSALIILPMVLWLLLQTTYYFATYKKENIYLSQSEEIYPDENIWAVRGCYTKSCDSESSIYFRIKPSLFHHLWNIGHSGNIFLPDTIGSSVPTGLTNCEVISYGVRLRILMTFNIYPSVLKITCDDYGRDNSEPWSSPYEELPAE